jgi:hypothetical protein
MSKDRLRGSRTGIGRDPGARVVAAAWPANRGGLKGGSRGSDPRLLGLTMGGY